MWPVSLIGASHGEMTSWPSVKPGQLGQVLGHRRAGHREAVAVDGAVLQQQLQHGRRAADLVEILHHVLAARLEVGEERDPVADRLEVVDGQIDTPTERAMAIRCSTALVEPPRAIVMTMAFSNACPGHDVAWLDVPLQQRRGWPRRPARHSSSLAGSVAGVDEL